MEKPSDIETAHGGLKGPRPRSSPPPPPLGFSAPTPQPWTSWLVPLIFVVNIALFGYSMYLNNCPSVKDDCLLTNYLGRFSFQPFKENPLLGPSTKTLQNLGALQKELVVDKDEKWRFFTCMFLHAGVIHIVANMFSLLSIGIRLEREFGFLRIGFLYMLAGLAGSLTSLLHSRSSSKPTISVGASGALFGLLGAMLSELLTNWTIYANKCAALSMLLLISALNLSLGFLPHVDNSAHIGGFIAGFLLGFILMIRPQYGYVNRKYVPPGYDVQRKSKYKTYQYVFFVTSSILLIVGYVVAFTLLYQETTPEKIFLLKDKREI